MVRSAETTEIRRSALFLKSLLRTNSQKTARDFLTDSKIPSLGRKRINIKAAIAEDFIAVRHPKYVISNPTTTGDTDCPMFAAAP
jgi:hypothetical protein